MTLAPDRTGYHARGEVDDAPEKVSIIPPRQFKHLSQPPVDAPGLSDLAMARDVVLAHLWHGTDHGDPWELIWAGIAVDLDDPTAIPYQRGEALVLDYQHYARLNDGADWAAQDADDIRQQITRALTAAGYTERTTA